MRTDEAAWLDNYSVTCRVFKGRWSVRHCLRMYNDIKDLKIRMSSRADGKVTRHESTYNPCSRCQVLAGYLEALSREENMYEPQGEPAPYNEVWAM